MSHSISRRAALSILMSGVAGAALANAPATSPRPSARGGDFLWGSVRSAQRLVDKARLGGTVGFAVADATSATLLESGNATTGLPPASVAKALTAAYAMTVLGPGHHFETTLVATGGIEGGVIRGDLVLAGGGDPTLDTDALATMAERLTAAGVTGVAGRFLVWGGALPYARVIDPAQPEHVGYNPAISGLNLNFNRVHFEWRRGGDGPQGYSVTMEGRSETRRPAVRVARMAIVDRKVPIYTYADTGDRDTWTVARGALGKGGARWLPVRRPAIYAGEVFQSLARAQGIALSAPQEIDTLPEGVALVTHQSQPLRIVLRDMLKWSTNLTAEAVGQAATLARRGAEGLSVKASAAEMNGWARETLGMAWPALVDHSGLGDASRLSAADMALALVALHKRMGIKPILKPIAMRDSERKVVKDHPLEVRAKTGTLNFVSGLAGFIDTPDGREMAFAIFAADIDRRAGLSRAEMERPEGAQGWNRRAKILQQDLIDRWGQLYGT